MNSYWLSYKISPPSVQAFLNSANNMARLYNPRELYDPATMPLVEGWEETNNCVFVRFHWVATQEEQRSIDAHWRPLFYRHSLINTKMALATHAGVGVPGWDPFFGITEAQREALTSEEYYRLSDQSLGTKLARGIPVEPTGLAEDPRLPPPPPEICSEYSCDCSMHRRSRGEPPRYDIIQMLRDAAARYEAGVRQQHAKMLGEHAAQKIGSWAQRAFAPRTPPTLEQARAAYQERLSGPKEARPWWAPEPTVIPGIWHEWEIVEVLREQARQQAVEAAWERAEARVKSVLGEKWGGGT